MKADIIHISGFDTYNTHDSGNYIVFDFLRKLNYDSKMILALGKRKDDNDTFLITKNKIIDSIEEAKVIVLHDSLFSYGEVRTLYEKLKCQIVIITMTHFHLTTPETVGCPSYPETNSQEEREFNESRLKEKEEAFACIPITLVYGSTYTRTITEQFKMYKQKCFIPLPAEIPYCKSSTEDVRKYLKLNNIKKYIFWGTTQPKTQRKGKSLFDQVLDFLWHNLTGEQRQQIVILNAGPEAGKFGLESEFATIYCGYQKTRREMSTLYRASDISVCTTIADAGPMMISESMCNETPVIAFDRSIACDLCIDGETGYLIKDLDLKTMARSIKKILFEDDLREMSKKSRKKYLTFQSSSAIMEKWNNLFIELMEKK